MFQKGAAHADAGVRAAKQVVFASAAAALLFPGFDLDAAAGRRVFHRVADDVEIHLPHAQSVPYDHFLLKGGQAHGQFKLGGLGLRLHQGDHFADQLGEVEGLLAQRELPAFDF